MREQTGDGGQVKGLSDTAILSRVEAREMASTLEDGRILVGDVRAILRGFEANSVHCVVTSPPYWSLRSYSTNPQRWGGDPDCAHAFEAEPTAEGYTGKRKWQHSSNGRGESQPEHKTLRDPVTRELHPEAWSQVTRGDTCRHCGAWRGELGGEPTPELYVEHIIEVFREVRRVLRRDGTCWINLGDSYASSGGHASQGVTSQRTGRKNVEAQNTVKPKVPPSFKPKDLVGIPWRIAFALQADGWYLRSDVIWSKPNPMPESVADRPTKSHEYVFLLSKSSTYYYDADAVRRPFSDARMGRDGSSRPRERNRGGRTDGYTKPNGVDPSANGGANQRTVWPIDPRPDWWYLAVLEYAETYFGPEAFAEFVTAFNGEAQQTDAPDVWEIPTQPTPEAHFATYPEKLVEPCILAGTSERGVCRECGASWRRSSTKTFQPTQDPANTKGGTKGMDVSRLDYRWGDVPRGRVERETTGWQPTCTHDAPVVPATVLDIFLGSGTTGRVAERLGRRWIGIELNENYAEIARRRTAQMGLLQWAGGAT